MIDLTISLPQMLRARVREIHFEMVDFTTSDVRQDHPQMHACVLTSGHVTKDGGYPIRSAIPENPMLLANIMVLCLTEWELLLIKVLHCGNRNFRPFWLL